MHEEKTEIITEPVVFTDGTVTYHYNPERVPLGAAELALEYLAMKQQSLVSKAIVRSFEDLMRSGLAEFNTGCCALLLRRVVATESDEAIRYASFNAEEANNKIKAFLQNSDDPETEVNISRCLKDFFARRKHSTTYSNVLAKDLIGAERKMSYLQLLTNMRSISNEPASLPNAASEKVRSIKQASSNAGLPSGKKSRS